MIEGGDRLYNSAMDADEASLCAVLSIVPYLDFDEAPSGRTTLGQIARQRRSCERDRLTDGLFMRFCEAIELFPQLGYYVVSDVLPHTSFGKRQISACVITGERDERCFVVYRGTNFGEWSDNAVALSGADTVNVYPEFDRRGNRRSARMVRECASLRQAHALNYLNRVLSEKRFRRFRRIIVAGHSKGGNKAQFAAIHSPAVSACYSFDGQGFSPEALKEAEQALGSEELLARRRKIFSVSSYNDFVNVMGERAALPEQTFFVDSPYSSDISDYHLLSSIIDKGRLRDARERGELSKLGENLWKGALSSDKRVLAAMTLMTMCEHIYGDGVPYNGEALKREAFYRGSMTSARIFVESAVKTAVDNVRQELASWQDMFRKTDDADGERSFAGRGIDAVSGVLGDVESRIKGFIKGDKGADDRYGLDRILTGASVDKISFDADILHEACQKIEAALAGLREALAAAEAGPDEREEQNLLRDIESRIAKAELLERILFESAKRLDETEAELAELVGLIFNKGGYLIRIIRKLRS